MNWGCLVTNLIIGGIVGVGMKGTPRDVDWWVIIVLFWVVMLVRDYFVRGRF